METKYSTIIYECDHSGHRVEYVGHLINYLNNVSDLVRDRYVFFIAPALYEKLKSNNYKLENINIFQISNCYENQKLRSIYLIKDLKVYLNKCHSVTSLILLNFDLFQYILFFVYFKKSIHVKTIWFRPIHQIPRHNYKDYIVSLIKTGFINALSLKMHNQLSIFILNDSDGVYILNNKYLWVSHLIFKLLGDPVESVLDIEESVNTLRLKRNISSNSLVFLIIGTIDAKKNIENILSAFLSLNSGLDITIIIAGKVKDNYLYEFETLTSKFKSVSKNIKLIIENRFVTKCEFHEYFKLTDFVLMVYKDFYSSSGIFGYTCLYKKPVLVSNIGLMKSLVNKYKIGFSADPSSAIDIAKKIQLLLEFQPESKFNFDLYLKNNSVESFSKALL